VGACCDDAVHSRQGAHHGSCQTAACVNCKATCMRPVHACTCMRPRTLGLCLHVHASCACTVCVHGFFRCVHHVSTMYGVACTGCPVWMCVSTGGVRRARFYLRMRVHRSGCIPHTYILKVVHYIHGRCTSCELCGVCAHVYGRDYVHGFFSCVHRTRPLTHRCTCMGSQVPPRVSWGWHARPREGGAHTYLGKAALVGCAHSQQRAHATKARKKQRTRQRLNVFRWKAG
jgi:hypothetical protein